MGFKDGFMFQVTVMSFVVGLIVAYTGQIDRGAWGEANLYTLWAFGVAAFCGCLTFLMGRKAERIFSAILVLISLVIASHYFEQSFQVVLY